MFVQAAKISFCQKIETGTWVPRILTALPEPCYPGLEMFGDSWAVSPLESEVSKPQAIVWLLQLRDGLEIPGKTELPEDKRRGKQFCQSCCMCRDVWEFLCRKGATPPNNTACVGINTWETAIVGQDNGFAVSLGSLGSSRLMQSFPYRKVCNLLYFQ